MTYDYNATYGTLKVYNQETEGACVTYAIDVSTAAILLMHTGHQPTWPDDGKSYPKLVQGGFVGSDYIDYYVTMEGIRHALRSAGSDPDLTPDHLRALLLASGVMTLGVNAVASFTNPPPSGGLPVIRPLPSDTVGYGHDTLAVGFTQDGLIVHNSYGSAWGYRGRAVLSWEWLTLHGTGSQRYQVDEYPIGGAPLPPQPPEDKMILLAQRTPASPVFAFLGGCRSWVPSRTVLPSQGLSLTDVKVVDGSDPMWTLPMVGTLPPKGDI